MMAQNEDDEFYDCEDDIDQTEPPPPQPQPSPKKFDAFFIRGSVSDAGESGMTTDRSDVTVAESYVIDAVKTPEAARAAGIPIIDNSNADMSTSIHSHRLSREGSVASSKSSGDFSDHESHKIHSDHKTRETRENQHKAGGVKFDVKTDQANPSAYIIQKPIIMNRQTKGLDGGKMSTNFAQIKHMKDVGQVDNSGFVYMQHGKDDDKKNSLKDTFQRKQAEKKTTFAPLPNQTTWQNTQNAANLNVADENSSPQNGSASQELLKLKMKLEEKRRAIERKKHSQEIQQQKMRQRLGKAAFLHVVSKTKEEGSLPDSANKDVTEIPSRMTTSDSELAGSSSALANSRMTSSSPLKSPSHQKVPRPFSRDDIQQTIENVRKKWFQPDDQIAPEMREPQEQQDNVPYEDEAVVETEAPDGQITPRPVFDRRSASIERITSLADQMDASSPRSDPSPQMSPYSRRSVSVERTDPRYNNKASPPHQQSVDNSRRSTSADRTVPRSTPRRQSADDKPESYEEYNSSLDQLNKSLTDLQGEIMKLSLKQKQAVEDPQKRSRSRSPPHDLEVKQKNLPEQEEVRQSRSSQPAHSQSRSASEPRQLPPEPAGPDTQLGGYQSHTLPRQPGGYPQGQMGGYMSQSAGPTGPVYGSPSQFVQQQQPVAGYGTSYILGPPTPGHLQHPHLGYQQSPPQGYPPPGTAGTTMYPGQPYMVSPQTQQQQYGVVYSSPPHYQPIPPTAAGTYTTSVLPQQMPLSQPPLFDPNTQHVYPPHQPYPTHHPQDYTGATRGDNSSPPQHHQTVPTGNYTQQQTGSPAHNRQTGSSSVHMSDNVNRTRTQSEERKVNTDRTHNDSGVETQYNESDKTGGFFVSFNEGSPRRNKPQLSDKKKPDSQLAGNDASKQLSDSEKFGSSVIADFAHKVAEQSSRATGSDDGNQSNSSGPSQELGQAENQPEAVGFVIGQDDSLLDQVRIGLESLNT